MNKETYNKAFERELARLDAELRQGAITGAAYGLSVMASARFYDRLARDCDNSNKG